LAARTNREGRWKAVGRWPLRNSSSVRTSSRRNLRPLPVVASAASGGDSCRQVGVDSDGSAVKRHRFTHAVQSCGRHRRKR
jgi:hypothetical protein